MFLDTLADGGFIGYDLWRLGKVQVSIRIAAQLADALEVPLSQLWRDIEQRQSGNRKG